MFTYNVYEYKGSGEYIHEKEIMPIIVCKTQEIAQTFLNELYKIASKSDGITPMWQEFSGRLIIFYNGTRDFKLYGIEREFVYTATNEARNRAYEIADNL